MAFQVLHEWCGSNFCWFDSSMVSLFTNHCKMGSQFLRFATNYYLLFCIFKPNSLKFAAKGTISTQGLLMVVWSVIGLVMNLIVVYILLVARVKVPGNFNIGQSR